MGNLYTACAEVMDGYYTDDIFVWALFFTCFHALEIAGCQSLDLGIVRGTRPVFQSAIQFKHYLTPLEAATRQKRRVRVMCIHYVLQAISFAQMRTRGTKTRLEVAV